MEIYNHLKESFENFQYKDGVELKTGSTAFHKFWSILMSGRETSQYGSQKAFEGIIKLFEIILDKLVISKNNKVDIELVLFLTELQFNQYLWESLKKSVTIGYILPNNVNSLQIMVSRIEKIEREEKKKDASR